MNPTKMTDKKYQRLMGYKQEIYPLPTDYDIRERQIEDEIQQRIQEENEWEYYEYCRQNGMG